MAIEPAGIDALPEADQVLAIVPHHAFERRAMGSPLRLTVTGVGAVAARRAWERVSADIERTEAELSRFREESDITRLNRAVLAGRAAPGGGGPWIPIPRRLLSSLVAARRAWRATDGRFDPRVLADLERLGFLGVPVLPDGRDTHNRPTMEPGEWLECDPRRGTARLTAPVDLGGIGKGLALRWAWRALRRGPGAPAGALLEAGGDLVLDGPAPDGDAWRIGIEDPCGREWPIAVLHVGRGAVVTSSVQVQRWQGEDGRVVHHLIDPLTGEPGGEGLLSVTVAGRDPAWSEIWSKTLFLCGRTRVAHAARASGLAAWWVAEDGSLEMTPAARPMTIWTASGY
jgi:thiamine biosynthesis lipoprotein